MSKHRSRHGRKPAPAPPERLDNTTVKRIANNYMLYWLVCGAGACRRKRGCAGDAVACFERLWPVTPEAMKVHFRASIMAIGKGETSAAKIGRIAQAEVERAAEHIAYADALQARAREAQATAEKNKAEAPEAAGDPPPASGEMQETRSGPRVRAL